LIGAAAGLKLTLAPFALGALLATPILVADPTRRWHLSTMVVVAMGIGFFATAGAWMLELHARYGSPLFPLFGLGLDGVPTAPTDLRDLRFVPAGIVRTVFYPIAFALHPRSASEQWFLDLRLPLLFLALPLLLKRATTDSDDGAAASIRRFLALTLAIGYGFWLLLSGYYRYAAPLEMLAPLLLATIVLSRWPQRRVAMTLLAVLLLVITGTTRAPRWGRVEFGERFLAVEAPPLPPGAIVALAGDRPLAFLALALGEDHDYVRVSGGLVGEPLAPWLMDSSVANAFERNARPVFALFQDAPERVASDYARFGLVLESSHCEILRTNLALVGDPPIRVCPARRQRAARAALAEVEMQWTERCRTRVDPPPARACRALAEALAQPGSN
jgi:uncharacterized membrane protein YqjE